MKNNKAIKIVLDTVLKSKLHLISLIFVTISVVVLSISPPQILRVIIDNNLIKGNSDGLIHNALLYLLVIILIGIFDFIKGGLLVVFGQKIIVSIRVEMNKKLQKIGMQYYSKNSASEISSRFINDVDNINTLFSEGIVSMFIDCMKILGIIISIAIFNIELSVFVVVIVPIVMYISRFFQKKMLVSQVENLVQLSKVNDHITQSLKNVIMIKAFGKVDYMEKVYEKKLDDNFKTIDKVNFYDSCYAPIIQIIRASVISIIVLLSSSQIHIIGISLGMVAASIDLITSLFQPIEALGMEIQSIQKGISGIKRIDEFLSTEEMEEVDKNLTCEIVQKNFSGAKFQFENVHFSYADGNSEVLKGIDLEINSGENITFAGRTGVGKTTLFKLIMGLEKPTSGRITINGFDVYKIPNIEKSKLIGYVEQSFTFVSGTILDQVTLGKSNISREQAIDALKFVGMYEYIMSLSEGLDTTVDRNIEFSQGQKQLLAIARAIVTNPPVLLLDEVSANLDTVTEELVIGVLLSAKEGRTIISVSHRLSDRLRCDRLIHIEDGKIIDT